MCICGPKLNKSKVCKIYRDDDIEHFWIVKMVPRLYLMAVCACKGETWPSSLALSGCREIRPIVSALRHSEFFEGIIEKDNRTVGTVLHVVALLSISPPFFLSPLSLYSSLSLSIPFSLFFSSPLSLSLSLYLSLSLLLSLSLSLSLYSSLSLHSLLS